MDEFHFFKQDGINGSNSALINRKGGNGSNSLFN